MSASIERNSNMSAAFFVVGVTAGARAKYKFLSGYDDAVTAQTAAHEWQVEQDKRNKETDPGMDVEVMPRAKFFELRPDLTPES